VLQSVGSGATNCVAPTTKQALLVSCLYFLMSFFSAPRPKFGRILSALVLAGLALASTALSASPAPLAADRLPSPELTRLRGQTIEQWSIKAPDARGTVVFENGSRAELEGWRAVLQSLAPSGAAASSAAASTWSLFAYHRPGVGRSEATERPRDGQQIVADLRELLQQQGLKPPYLLVGHSLGGLYMQLFARQHPGEVKGLLLVDALYPV